MKENGLPTLIVKTDDNQWVAGKEEPQGSVSAPKFELLRGLTGRRTHEEIKAFDWTCDAAFYLGIFSPYDYPAAPLNE